MPATTPNGLQYPLGTDRIMDGDDTVQALAKAVRITQGSVLIPSGALAAVAITFPTGLFTAAPQVLVSTSSQFFTPYVVNNSQTVNGAQIAAVYRSSTGAIADNPSATQRLFWIAAQFG